MKQLLCIMMMLLIPAVTFAITPAEAISKSSAKLTGSGAVVAKFSGSVSGTLTVSGKKFAMDAGAMGVWFNGTDMWTYSKKAGETSLTTPTAAELMESNPIEIIKGYKGKFNVSLVSQKGNVYTVKLTPKSQNNSVKSATIAINTSTWLPQSMDVTFSNDSRMTINITSIKTGASVGASTFEYPKSRFPGIEIVDLR